MTKKTEFMRKNRRRNNELRAERSLSVRFSQSVLDEINEYWEERGFANRTDLIEIACKTYLESNICPRCNALNPPNGVICSVCSETLTPYHQLQTKVYKEYEVFSNTIRKTDDIIAEIGLLIDNYEICLNGQNIDLLNSMRAYHLIFAKDQEQILSSVDNPLNIIGRNNLVTPDKLQKYLTNIQIGTEWANHLYIHLVQLKKVFLLITKL